MNISTAFSAGRLTVYLSGELDHHAAKETMQTLDELLDEYMPRDCVLDLSALGFMDSSGIAVIVRTSKRMKELSGRVWIENPGKQVLRVIDAAGIERLIPIAVGR